MSDVDFSTPEPEIEAGIERAFKEIVAPASALHKLRKSFAEAHRAGDSRKEVKAVKAALAGVQWSWPVLDEWHKRFRSTGFWPLELSTHAQFGRRDDVNEDMLEERIEELALMISRHIFTVRDFMHELPTADYQWRVVVDSGLTRPELLPLVAECSQVFRADDLSTWPPYFPADGTYVQSWHPKYSR